VAITHRAAANTLADIDQRIGLSAADRVFGISALHFDLAIYDVFATLSQGAALVLPAPDASRDAPHWLDLVQRHRVTVWNSVPALCRMLLNRLHTMMPVFLPALPASCSVATGSH
jgi:pyochelin synthetase